MKVRIPPPRSKSVPEFRTQLAFATMLFFLLFHPIARVVYRPSVSGYIPPHSQGLGDETCFSQSSMLGMDPGLSLICFPIKTYYTSIDHLDRWTTPTMLFYTWSPTKGRVSLAQCLQPQCPRTNRDSSQPAAPTH